MRYLLLALVILLAACMEEEVVEAKVLPVDFVTYGLSCASDGVVKTVFLQIKNTANSSVSIASLSIGGTALNSTELPLELGVGATKTVSISPATSYFPGFSSVTTRTVDLTAAGPSGDFTKQMVFKGTRCP